MKKSIDWTIVSLAVVIMLFISGLLGVALWSQGKQKEPAEISVRCVGDHLILESLDTGDIQVIPNKCKKVYPKNQAPITDDK